VKGTIVGNHRIIDTLSVGGMGTVYRAEHTLLGRLAAVKIVHPELCANRDIVNRFFNEAKATTSIKHPGIVEVFDFGYMASGHAFLIMELLEGQPLSHRMRARGPIPEGEAALILRGVCIALSAAHDKGVVHRDLKPDNIYVIADPDSALGERTKILDFGIAKLTDIGLAGTTTKTGAVMGTPTYMSPEQCRGTGEVDARADLYSIGCMFYELVAGQPPFVRSGAGELIGSHLFVDPEPPSRHIAGLSAETDALIMCLLAKQPERRVQTAKELAHILTAVAQQHGWPILGDLSRPSLGHVIIPPPAGGGFGVPAASVGAAPLPAAMLPTTITPYDRAHPAPPAMPTRTPPAMPAPAPLSTLSPTTLSGASGELARRGARRGLKIAIAAGLAAAAAGILAIVGLGGDPGQPAAGTPPRAASPTIAPGPAPASPAAAEPAPTPPTTAVPATPAAAAAPPTTSPAALRITSPAPPAATPAAAAPPPTTTPAPPAATPAAAAPPTTTPAAPPTTTPAAPRTTIPAAPRTTIPAPPTTTPAAPRTTIPAAPPTTTPAAPRTTTPATPRTTTPATPRTTTPAAPRTTIPAAPRTTIPAAPRTTIPAAPRTTIPAAPPTTIPAAPPTTIPAAPPTTIPAAPPTTTPATPRTTTPAAPRTTTPAPPAATPAAAAAPPTTTRAAPRTTTPAPPTAIAPPATTTAAPAAKPPVKLPRKPPPPRKPDGQGSAKDLLETDI
jgi:eukaryotic-like serine/threonine-protein kinase